MLISFLFKLLDIKNFFGRLYFQLFRLPYLYFKKYARKIYWKVLRVLISEESFERIIKNSWKKRGII